MNKKSIAMPIALVIVVLALVATAFWGYTQMQEKEAVQQQLQDRMKIGLEASGVENVTNFGDYLSGDLGECKAEFTPTEKGWKTELVQFPTTHWDNAKINKIPVDYTSVNDLDEDLAMLCYGGGKYDLKEMKVQSPY